MFRIHKIPTVTGCLLILLVSGCSSSTSSGGPGAIQQASLPAPQIGVAVASAAQAEYRIGPLDLLEISVFQVPELSKSVKVNASGVVALPLIGTVTAGGRTVAELESEITAKLAAKYMQNPEVTVFVKESTSQRVTVDGAVEKPGIVPLTGPTTLMQTVAMSGGLKRGAKPREIVVFRSVGTQRTAAKFDLTAIRKGQAQDPLLYGGDIVVVESSGVRTAFSDVVSAIPVFSVFMAL